MWLNINWKLSLCLWNRRNSGFSYFWWQLRLAVSSRVFKNDVTRWGGGEGGISMSDKRWQWERSVCKKWYHHTNKNCCKFSNYFNRHGAKKRPCLTNLLGWGGRRALATPSPLVLKPLKISTILSSASSLLLRKLKN